VGRNVRSRGPRIVLVALAALVQVACLGDGEPPTQLVDGSPARAPSVTLDGVASRQVGTKAAALDLRNAATGPVARCLATTRQHVPHAPIVWRVGVDGASVTFRTSSRRDLVACDGTALTAGHSPTWCGVALARMRGERLLDPRLDLASCSTQSGDSVVFAWVHPRPGTRYLAVRRDGFAEVYTVVSGLPVRVASTSGVDLGTSSASFGVSEHDADGRVLRMYTLRARVAG
jgi:hypothetical protein